MIARQAQREFLRWASFRVSLLLLTFLATDPRYPNSSGILRTILVEGGKVQPQCPRTNPDCGNAANGEDGDDDAYQDEEEEDWKYDPSKEDPIDKCRRDPTWKEVDYDECQRLSEWEPRDTYWRLDINHNEYYMDGREDDIHECIHEKFQYARKHSKRSEFEWARCNETARDEYCEVATLDVMSHYRNKYEGEVVTLLDVVTEQEAYGLQALLECKNKYLPKDLPWYDDRSFGAKDLYDPVGGNQVHFVQGMIQLFLPGLAASIYRAFMASFEEADWSEPGYPVPSALGMRTAETLYYKTTGQLGTHIDTDSVYSISVALSEEEDYHGGLFRLTSDYGLFKVPRLGALVYFADAQHGVTQIAQGRREVFVAELWENDDVPVGTPRPDYGPFSDFMEKRLPVLNGIEEEYYNMEGDADPTGGINSEPSITGDAEEPKAAATQRDLLGVEEKTKQTLSEGDLERHANSNIQHSQF